ncbi:MAG TPA: HAD family hydrolase [Clostridiales bacterium]|nr:HAD family hydrolase [Clostridiales bacterium]
MDWKSKKFFVLDMDGTFYRGEHLLEGSLDFIHRLTALGRDYLFFTNNSSKNSRRYAEKLNRMGLAAGPEKIITSGMVTLNWLSKNHPGKSIYLIGTPDFREICIEAGLYLVEDGAQMVLVGFDTSTTYEQMTRACDLIREGALFVATHPDTTCPTESGFVPDAGAVCAFISAATGGTKPVVLGKPYTPAMEYLLDTTGVSKEELVFVGDRLYTDIAIGARHGVSTVLVLTGETRREDLAGSAVVPDLVVERLVDLGDHL